MGRLRNATPRQEEIVELVGEGLRDKDIADRLGIALPTVRNQLALCRKRIGVHSRIQLALLAAGVTLTVDQGSTPSRGEPGSGRPR